VRSQPLIVLVDRWVVDARNAPAHQAFVVERPELGSIRAVLLARVVATLVFEPDRLAGDGPSVPAGLIQRSARPSTTARSCGGVCGRAGRHGIDPVDPVYRLPGVLWSREAHRDVDAANDEDPLLGFHLAGHVGGEAAVAGIDLTRLQRASKGADH
jgi:hypothetical protein